jgi:hypothetical protein
MELPTSASQLIKAWNAMSFLGVATHGELACVYRKTICRWIQDFELEAFQLRSRTFSIPEVAIGKLIGESSHERPII